METVPTQLFPWILGLSLISGVVLTRWYHAIALNLNLVDSPNNRSSHTIPTASGAGVVFSLLWVILIGSYLLYREVQAPTFVMLLPCSMGIAILGFIDDFRGLSSRIRLIIQFLVCTVFVYTVSHLNQPIFIEHIPIIILGTIMMVWSINIYNFMDGINGIAGMEGIFYFGTSATIFLLHGATLPFLGCSAMASLIIGFLIWNFPNARVFMGDCGSGFLGFLVGAIALIGFFKYQIPILIWAIIFALFGFDGTVTLIRRIILKHKWDQAHRLHAYQRLHHQLGWSHKRVVIHLGIINTFLSGMAIFVAINVTYLPHAIIATLTTIISLYTWLEFKAPFPKDLNS